jgi:hypothetical protein
LCALAIAFGASVWVLLKDSGKWKLWAYYSGVLGTLDGLVAFVAYTWGFQLSCGDSPTFVVPLWWFLGASN